MPGKIENISIGSTEYNKKTNTLMQQLKWRSQKFDANYNFEIVYGNDSVVNSEHNVKAITKSYQINLWQQIFVNSTIPTSRVTYNFWVAAISDAGIGEYSDRVQIIYDGKSDF